MLVLFFMKRTTTFITVPLVALSAGLAFVFARRKNKMPKAQVSPYPGNVLGEHKAQNAVTGGHPEEMNGMPPAVLANF